MGTSGLVLGPIQHRLGPSGLLLDHRVLQVGASGLLLDHTVLQMGPIERLVIPSGLLLVPSGHFWILADSYSVPVYS